MVDGGGGVGVAGTIVRSVDGVIDGAGDGAGADGDDAMSVKTLVNEDCADGGGEVGNEPPAELLREVVGLASSVSRAA